MTISAKMTVNPYAQDDAVDELSRLIDTLNLARGKTFSEGEGANQVDMIFHDLRALANSANETINFHDGTLTNKVGISITMDKFKVLFVKNLSTDADLTIGAAAATQLALFGAGTHSLVLPPLGEFVFIAPGASGVDCTTNADLKFALGAGSSAPGYELVTMGVDVA